MFIIPHVAANSHPYPTWYTAGGPASFSGDMKTLSSYSSNSNFTARSNNGKSKGRWYGEIFSGGQQYSTVGIVTVNANLANYIGGDVYGYGYAEVYDYPNPGDIGCVFNNAGAVASPAQHMRSTMGIALDLVSNQVSFYGDGSLLATVSIYGDTWYLAGGGYLGNSVSEAFTINCGPSTNYAPPSGYERWYW